jgi:ribonucleotide reductase beta subunit family protein with ferritin-like domain
MNILEQAKSRLLEKNLLDGAFSDERIKASDKSILGNGGDVNQLIPIKYEWAWQKYLDGCANHWMPQEVSMQKDVAQWKDESEISEGEKHIVYAALGFFSTADTMVANNLVLAIYERIKSPEHRQYILRQAFEEAIHCYIDGTEILTENGFIDFRDLKEGVKVAQYHENGDIDYVIPDEILHDRYVGKMYEFKNSVGSYHKIVTPDHRCVVIDPRSNNDIKIKLAKDLSTHNYNLPVTGLLKNKFASKLTMKERLQIAFQADGHILNSHTVNMGEITGHQVISFQFAKNRKIDALKSIVDSLGLGMTERKCNGENLGQTVIKVWIPNDWDLNKDFSWIDYSKINSEWASDFISEVSKWDGHIRDGGQIIYCNTNKIAVDNVQAVAHLSGKRTGLYNTKVIGNRKQSYQLHIFETRGHVSGRTVKKSEIHHDGYVHCVGVPTGMIITRYNGSIVVSGNTHAYQYCIESLSMDQGAVFNQYREVPEMAAKMSWAAKHTQHLNNTSSDQDFLENLIAFYVVFEGIFFYCGFPSVLSLGRRNKMNGVAEQFQYILRDESMHLNFGIDTINQIKIENPELWSKNFQDKIFNLIMEGLVLAIDFSHYVLPNDVLGMNQRTAEEYLKYITNRRLMQIGLPIVSEWEYIENPLPWMSEMMDLRKEKNFFETRVTDYQAGGLDWDD